MATPTEDSRRAQLLQIMQENGIKPEDLPQLTGYSQDAIKAWLMPDRSSSRARGVPQRALALLISNLEAAKARLRS